MDVSSLFFAAEAATHWQIASFPRESRFLQTFSVVDIFAGPGGLAEGFSSVQDSNGDRAFSIALSIEKESAAHSTLQLRAFLRQFRDLPEQYYEFLNGGSEEPDWAILFPAQWERAREEAWQFELGAENPDVRLDRRLDTIREESSGNVVLIGGPPCQAYSLVGRARNQGKEGYVAADDNRHFLYREYIRILDRLRPAAFIMENVKGMLSSSVDGENRIFDKVLEDLRGDRPGAERYELVALTPRSARQLDLGRTEPLSADFVVRAEDFGIPQARHRVIVVGIRQDLAALLPVDAMTNLFEAHESRASIGDVLDGMPRLRSGLSRSTDGPGEWRKAVLRAISVVAKVDTGLTDKPQLRFTKKVARYKKRLKAQQELPPREGIGTGISTACPAQLREWLVDDHLTNLSNHQARSHMESDLARYFYAAVFAEVTSRSPKAADFPAELAPDHKNWTSGKFADRFRVQVRGSASTTVTSHIAKDGHYFIHPDPLQCRSLSVREAARLQTFPDNYFFKGNRTEQYIQVGNAVPPLLAKWIGSALWSILTSSEVHARANTSAGRRLSHVA